MSNKIAVTFTELSLQRKAALLAKKLQLPLVDINEQHYEFLLSYTARYLEIRAQNPQLASAFHIDFLAGKLGFRRAHTFIKNELLAKAVGVKGNHSLSIIDATAGIGRDSFILACLGCNVIMLERSPIIAALLVDGLARLVAAKENSEKLNITLVHNDAITYLKQLDANDYPDVIYLDPMYPHRIKSALVKKEMRILRELVGNDNDATQLLLIAMQRAKKRVVVKRPRSAPTLNEQKPQVVYQGKQHRFDVYLI